MAKKPRRAARTRIDTVRHKDKRKNIPTEELRDFVREDEEKPKTVLYPRDPDLDPQLVWKGKDEQDVEPLEVPAVPVYIQEKIHPQAIIEDFKASVAGPREKQADLFSDFNGLPEDFADRVDFYHHEGNWSNRLILGDSLLVMTSLAEKENLKGRVQMIYIDPPYGIKFGSNWQVSTRKRDVRDGRAEDVVRQPEQIRAFRDTWEKGIHSYLAYLRDRFVVARDLLTESGSIFVQIGDENVHLVRCLLDEVFGADNFVTQIPFVKTGAQTDVALPTIVDYVLWYAGRREQAKTRPLLITGELSERATDQYPYAQLTSGERRRLSPEEKRIPSLLPEDARLYQLQPLHSQHVSRTRSVPFRFRGRTFLPPANRQWATSLEGLARLSALGRIEMSGDTIRYVRYFDEFAASPLPNVWFDTSTFEERIFVVQTNRKVVERCVLMTTDPGDLVLDPTCGSGTTAYVAEQWGRRWITIDTSRVALTLARTRLMAGRFPYYQLADDYPQAVALRSDEDIKKHLRKTAPAAGSAADVRKGFIYKRVPHVTLKAIANNEEIDVIHEKWQPKQAAARARLDKELKKKWEEWEVPHEADTKWPKEAKAAHQEFWRLRRQRQKEIDASIARQADQEVLYDQPYEDTRRVRVSGPLTVESLSPHRTISVEEKKELAETPSEHGFTTKLLAGGRFSNMILENLRTAGVQNTIRNERMKFDTLEVYAGQWINGAGEYTEKDGTVRRVAVCIGPEYGTVGPELVKEAAKEAVQGVGFGVLVVCGFAFDPHVNEEAKRYGNLVVLPTRMNSDLTMAPLLKKTGSGNLFMVFGEPDIEVKTGKDGELTVEVRGLDVYDPTTGEIRSSSTDDIACWFIDTSYDGESFFVRHAYFTGADGPYDKLKRALRAEVDEAAWSALYSTTSRPFDRPDSGKIAVKVINHYGDEVLKVYEV